MNDYCVTFLIGATNESTALKKTVEGILDTCNRQDIAKIMIVKSQSASKECNQTIEKLTNLYPHFVEGLEQTRPFVGGSIRDGADRVHSSHFLVVPADLAIELDVYRRMMEKEKLHPEGIVKVSRWLEKDSFENYASTRKFFNKCAQYFLRVLYHTQLTDLTIPVLIMPTKVYRSIRWRELNFPFLTEIVLCPLRLGIEIAEIPAKCYGRTEGKSNNSALQTMLYLKTALRVRFTKPENLLKQTERKK